MTTFDELSLSTFDVLDSSTDALDQSDPILVERLFAESEEPMIIVHATTHRVVEANPPAVTLLQTTSDGLIGSRLTSAFEGPSGDVIDACLATAQVAGSARSVSVRTRSGGFDLNASLSLFRTGAESYILVRIGSNDSSDAERTLRGGKSLVCETLDQVEFGFLITDANLSIDYANQTFVGMIDRSLQSSIVGSLLTDWVLLTESNLATMRAQLTQRQAVIRLETRFRFHAISRRRLEMYAVAVPEGRDSCWGFCIYDLPRLN